MAKAAPKPPGAVKTAGKPATPATVTLRQVAAELAEKHDLTKKDAEAILNDLVLLTTRHLKKGARLRLTGLGILQVRHRAARMGRNPATGEAIKIKASKKIAFRPAKELKELNLIAGPAKLAGLPPRRGKGTCRQTRSVRPRSSRPGHPKFTCSTALSPTVRARRREVEVLLVTSRETKRWIIPKGWPIKGLSPKKSAAREAYEEAGVLGAIRNKPIGRYVYNKMLNERTVAIPCQVRVFPLRVRRQGKTWPERQQRDARWFPAAAAAKAVMETGLQALIAGFTNGRQK